MKTTQCQRIIAYIEQFGSITTLEAFSDLGIARLASRIHDLKKRGYEFSTSWVKRKNRYGETVSFKRYKLLGGQND